MPEFSLIIPTLNEAEGIADLLSTLQVLRTQCEIIVVDGGSTDNTQQQAMPLVDRFICAKAGRAIQMNAGAEQAKGNVLIFLHADTYLPEPALQLIHEGIEAGALWGRFDIQLLGSHFMLNTIAFMMNWRSRVTGIATGDQAIFIKRSVFLEIGGFPEITLMEDIAISQRLTQLVRPYCIGAKVKSSARRWEYFGVWRTIALMWSIRLRYFFGAYPDDLARLYRKGHFW